MNRTGTTPWAGGGRYDQEARQKISDGSYIGGMWKRCPKCRSMNTVATRTVGEVINASYILHWRKCRNPGCKHPFKSLRPN